MRWDRLILPMALETDACDSGCLTIVVVEQAAQLAVSGVGRADRTAGAIGALVVRMALETGGIFVLQGF